MDNQLPVTQAMAPSLGRSVSIEQAANLLGVSRRTIYNRIREGRLLTIRTLGGSQRVLVESLLACGPRPAMLRARDAAGSFPMRTIAAAEGRTHT